MRGRQDVRRSPGAICAGLLGCLATACVAPPVDRLDAYLEAARADRAALDRLAAQRQDLLQELAAAEANVRRLDTEADPRVERLVRLGDEIREADRVVDDSRARHRLLPVEPRRLGRSFRRRGLLYDADASHFRGEWDFARKAYMEVWSTGDTREDRDLHCLARIVECSERLEDPGCAAWAVERLREATERPLEAGFRAWVAEVDVRYPAIERAGREAIEAEFDRSRLHASGLREEDRALRSELAALGRRRADAVAKVRAVEHRLEDVRKATGFVRSELEALRQKGLARWSESADVDRRRIRELADVVDAAVEDADRSR